MITLKATLCRKKQMKSKSYVVIVFGRYVRIALQKSRYNYVRKLRNKTMQMGTKKYVMLAGKYLLAWA